MNDEDYLRCHVDSVRKPVDGQEGVDDPEEVFKNWRAGKAEMIVEYSDVVDVNVIETESNVNGTETVRFDYTLRWSTGSNSYIFRTPLGGFPSEEIMCDSLARDLEWYRGASKIPNARFNFVSSGSPSLITIITKKGLTEEQAERLSRTIAEKVRKL